MKAIAVALFTCLVLVQGIDAVSKERMHGRFVYSLMSGQVGYYNKFGESYGQSILECPEPELWATDYESKGRIYAELKRRVFKQLELILTHFKKNIPVLDIGCGFGRQAVWMAREGFDIIGVDNCQVFISIAEKLFAKNGYKGKFICGTIMEDRSLGKFNQMVMLDVFEHIPPSHRQKMINRIANISGKDAFLIISLPHIRKRMSSWLNNEIRKRITQYLPFLWMQDEHPYPLPRKKKILKLLSHFFELKYFEETPETDYYVFRKLSS